MTNLTNETKRKHMTQLAQYRQELYNKPRLVNLFFELTDACNMSCLHCGSCASPKNKRFLDTGLIKNVLDEVALSYNPYEILVCFSGGEPLLQPDIYDLIEYTTKKGFFCGITTNAHFPSFALRLHKTTV